MRRAITLLQSAYRLQGDKIDPVTIIEVSGVCRRRSLTHSLAHWIGGTNADSRVRVLGWQACASDTRIRVRASVRIE